MKAIDLIFNGVGQYFDGNFKICWLYSASVWCSNYYMPLLKPFSEITCIEKLLLVTSICLQEYFVFYFGNLLGQLHKHIFWLHNLNGNIRKGQRIISHVKIDSCDSRIYLMHMLLRPLAACHVLSGNLIRPWIFWLARNSNWCCNKSWLVYPVSLW